MGSHIVSRVHLLNVFRDHSFLSTSSLYPTLTSTATNETCFYISSLASKLQNKKLNLPSSLHQASNSNDSNNNLRLYLIIISNSQRVLWDWTNQRRGAKIRDVNRLELRPGISFGILRPRRERERERERLTTASKVRYILNSVGRRTLIWPCASFRRD